MREESFEPIHRFDSIRQAPIPTTTHSQIMTEQFLSTYREALKYSNLQIDHHLKYRNVSIYGNQHIHQVYTSGNQTLPHLVLLHGYGGTSLTFIRTFQHLSNDFQVHALDTYGIGLSSRGKWSNDMTFQQAGQYYIDAIQQWRKTVGIQEFILAGHSFGGYISVLYLQKYPQSVKQLILLSPAGTATITPQAIQQRANRAKFFFCVAQKVYNLNVRPSRIMNTCWIGNKFINKILVNRLKLKEDEQETWRKYLKHIANQQQSSEKGFYLIFDWPLQPKRSIQSIINSIKPKNKIDFFYGDEDWMQPQGAHRLAKQFKNIKVHQITNAGHQLIFDNPILVTQKIKDATK